jgi:hypothetical protein
MTDQNIYVTLIETLGHSIDWMLQILSAVPPSDQNYFQFNFSIHFIHIQNKNNSHSLEKAKISSEALVGNQYWAISWWCQISSAQSPSDQN